MKFLADENVDFPIVKMIRNKDFGELVFRMKKANNGVILYRLSGLTNINKQNIIAKAIENHSEDFKNNFTVIKKNHIRIKSIHT